MQKNTGLVCIWNGLVFFGLVVLCLLAQVSAAQQPDSPAAPQGIAPQVVDQVRLLVTDIAALKAQLQKLDKKLTATEVDAEIQSLQAERQEVQSKLDRQSHSLEQLATGAADLSLFEQNSSDDFSWQAELKEVFKPLLYELKKISERPRQIEKLRSEQEAIATRIRAADVAIAEIKNLSDAVEESATQKMLGQLLGDWEARREELDRRRQLIAFQLNEKLDTHESTGTAVVKALKRFITGRGANILFATLAFVSVFLVLKWFSRFLERVIGKGRDSDRRFFARLVHVIFQVLTLLLSLLALMATLYALSDWLLLTLLLILLVGFAFALRNSLPRYFDEARLLLNLGPVREGERVIYNGLPWRVSRLNLYSDLVNPLLTGGRLKLPMSEVLGLISRRWSRNEPWFPTKLQDYVIMPDGSYGQVALQTPEWVYLNILGGAQLSFPTADFLAANPRNLSQGFGLFVSFGLDYGNQAHITQKIPKQLESYLSEQLNSSPFSKYINEMRVEFDAAAESSLNLKIISIFFGEAAQHYFTLQRFLQRATVDACNHYGWTIPFNQITVHMNEANNENISSQSSSSNVQ